MKEYDYSTLLVFIRAHIDKVYGNLTKFMEHEDFTNCGFQAKDKAKMYTYLSLPRNGSETKRIKSFPVLQKLFWGMFGIKIENRVKVVREQKVAINSSEFKNVGFVEDVVKKQTDTVSVSLSPEQLNIIRSHLRQPALINRRMGTPPYICIKKELVENYVTGLVHGHLETL